MHAPIFGRKVKCERGQVILLTALLIIPIIGILGIAMDSGYLFFTRRAMQTAADSAALAGSLDQANNSSTSLATVTAAAKADTKTNGFDDAASDVTVTVHSPPSSGAFTASGDYVEVIIEKSTPTVFMHVLSLIGVSALESGTVKARAVAGRPSILACFVAMNASADSSFFVGGNATINTPSCGVFVNSSSSTALTSGATGHGNCVTNLMTLVVGGTSIGCGITPTPVPGSGASSDPLAAVRAPTRPQPLSTPCSPMPAAVSGTITLNPAVAYCSISISATMTLAITAGATSRVIYIDGAGGTGFSLSGGPGTTVTATNMMFYVATGSVSASTNVVMNFSAPTTGTYAGILFFMGRSNASATTFNGTGTSNCKAMTGIFYAKSSAVSFGGSGTGTCTTNLILVADTMNIGGNFTIGSPLIIPSTKGRAHLVE